ncbi:MAG: hypothetical protein J5671_07695 [Bacteroidaceae bacterium]|nr:hypothetical protein [Bacteroidaceae bacterium]
MSRFKLIIYVVTALCTLFTIAVYLYHFHDGFSNQLNDWSNFGNFFNGVLSPVLAIINIIILIELTIAISNIDKTRTNAEIQAQTNLLLVQMRRQSIESFCQVMNNYFDNKYIKEDRGKLNSFVSDYLQRFLDIDYKYFFFENELVKNKICHLKTLINIIHNDMEIKHLLNEEKYLMAFELKYEIICALQANAIELLKQNHV